jgi:hypothetical protein
VILQVASQSRQTRKYIVVTSPILPKAWGQRHVAQEAHRHQVLGDAVESDKEATCLEATCIGTFRHLSCPIYNGRDIVER